ncbi:MULTISPECIES: MipA/OmpV family protein [Halomonadaceae]|uniref:MipA/OmpV family protein n=1 Tax=Halomonadaceae TaxID=28256 RepID=UPI00159A8A53|nr:MULTISPECIES: MipA/OmpV family protein [Halomonas]QJQ96098.1 MipA/OmpV family protein [Halomonas sp. PA5]
MTVLSRHWYASLALSLLPAMSMAQESPWQGSIGGGVIVAPDYLGSDDYDASPLPLVELRYGDEFYFSVRDGLGWNALQRNGWVLSPFIGYTFGRDNKGDLRRFDEVDGGLTLGTRLSYRHAQWHYSLSAEMPVTGDVDGALFEARASWAQPFQERWLATLGPSLTYSSKDWTQSMFRVSAADSARSGIRRHEPNDGYFTLGLGGTLSYSLTPRWSLTAVAGLAYLTGDAADSPIVEEYGDEWQGFAGAFIGYRF